jgi:hypothetical protein
MITCKLTIKIKDYFPKVDTIPYENYICLFTCGEYEGQIPFLPDDSKIIQHQIKNVTSDIKYKVHILDYNDMSLIGMCEMTVSYQIINQISPPNGFIQEQQKKLLIDLKTKRKLFGTIVNIGDIYLNIYAEVFLISRTSIEQKNINKIKKNLYQNTPQCYIKYNFQLNKSDYSPKSSKNKSSLINSHSEKHTLNSNNKQDKCFTNKHSNYNLINYKSNKENKEKDNDENNKKTYSSFNNNIKKGFKNYSSRIQQKKYSNNNVLKEQNRKTIMDLLQQKKMMEKKMEKQNLEKCEKSEVDTEKNEYNNNDNDNINENNENFLDNKKEGYLTEHNFNSHNGINLENKYIINNHKLKKQNKEDAMIYNKNNKIVKEGFKKSDNQITEKYNKNFLRDENKLVNKDESNKNFFNNKGMLDNIDIKNTLSPNVNNVLKNEENDFTKNLSKTVKSNNTADGINNKYVYKSKNKIVKMGKAFSKNKFNTKNNPNKLINRKYIANTDQNEMNSNINNKNNINTTLLSTYSADDDYLDIDRIILEKGAELRNDFHMQLKQHSLDNNFANQHRNMNKNKYNNQINNDDNNQINSDFNDYNNNYQKNENNNGIIGGTHFNMDTPRTEKMSQYSSTQSLNHTLTQENVKNNCLKLIEFYSLLNYKLKKINPKNLEIQKKLLIFKELFSTELKKNNKITNKSNLNQLIYNISTNINGPLNEKILYLIPKIKKVESSIYQCLFDVYFTDEDVIKFKEYENYDEQTKIFLLLTVIKNLISKYGNISQIFEQENMKKNALKQCLVSYDLIEKEEGDKDFVNLEELSHEIKIKNDNEIKEFNQQMDNKFKVIKEVDEDKEEENDEEEEEIKDETKGQKVENNHNIYSMNNTENNGDSQEKKKEQEKNNNLEGINENDMDDINVKDEEIIDKILIDEFRKKYKDNKYFFEKVGLNEYLYNNIKIKAILDKDGDIKIAIDENNEEYYLDDFIKIYNEIEEEDELEDNKNEIKNENIENYDIDLIGENKDKNEKIKNISDINNGEEYKEKEREEEKNKEDKNIENDDINDKNGMNNNII